MNKYVEDCPCGNPYPHGVEFAGRYQFVCDRCGRKTKWFYESNKARYSWNRKIRYKRNKEKGVGSMKYRKKPVVIDAIQFNGEMTPELKNFLGNAQYTVNFLSAGLTSSAVVRVLEINTLEGTMRANSGDYIIRGVNGEYYPCKPDIFEKTYERVEE